MVTDSSTICQLGRTVIAQEAQALLALQERLDEKFAAACQLLFGCRSRIIVMGMGKSGHVANKVAATFTCTGSPAFFLHPAEASHGDLGNITKDDVILAISFSGNTPEILAILPVIQHLNVPLVTLTGNTSSTLAKIANVNLDVGVAQEACPFGLAPTSSTTAALAMGDALAIALLEMRDFTVEDFARNHPGGVLGKKLCLLVDHIMRTDNDIPIVTPDTSIVRALLEISQKRMGMTTVVDEQGRLVGIYTDGDLRRTLDKKMDVQTTAIKDVMTVQCKTISPGTLAIEALQIMEKYRITSLVVVNNNGVPLGVLNIHDLLNEYESETARGEDTKM